MTADKIGFALLLLGLLLTAGKLIRIKTPILQKLFLPSSLVAGLVALVRGIGDFGQSMGVTATGLLLMRVADPDDQTPALESFGYKQLMFELFVGGGLFTAAAVPLVYQFGAGSILILSLVLTLVSMLTGIYIKKKRG